MPTKTNAYARGFTLVEMSIVLVIIGLIIGGILKGQEVIASARQKAVINQINAVRAASNTYFDRYRALPGDDPSAGNVDSSLNNGDGNGIVGNSQSSTSGLVNFSSGNAGENYQFFNGLVAANLLNGGQVTTSNTASAFGISALPAAPISGAGLTVVYGSHNGDGANAATYKTAHFLRIHKNVGSPAAAISPRTVQNIDTQIDDGVADTGGVRGDDSKCNSQGAGKAYTSSDDTVCVPLFEVTQ